MGRSCGDAFLATHDGFSGDEVILNDGRNAAFLAACRDALPGIDAATCNWTLLNLRKAGKLHAKVTQQAPPLPDNAYVHAAESAARLMADQFGLTLDRVLCDPAMRAAFDRTALEMVPEENQASAYTLRKMVMRLRKTRRLQPELVLRVADWNRRIITLAAKQIRVHAYSVPEGPGVYFMRDRSGYLYVGESANLWKRLTIHLDDSDRKTLANYLKTVGIEGVRVELHCFDTTSAARRVSHRRAYESELIRSRQPRFNLRP